MKIYVASSWRNTRYASVLEELRKHGWDVYDFKNPATAFGWEEIAPDHKNWTASQQREALLHPLAKRGVSGDFQAMQDADVLILVQECGRSAYFECGWAVGAKTETIALLADYSEPELTLALCHYLCISIEEVIARCHEIAKEKRAEDNWCDFPGENE